VSKYLVLVGYKDMGNWENCAECCGTEETNGLRYSDLIDCKLNDAKCTVLLIHQPNVGCLTYADIQSVLQAKGINPRDEIVLYCHEYKLDHNLYGTTEAELQELSENYPNLYFALFTAQSPDRSQNFPFWLITELCGRINQGVIDLISAVSVSWDELLKPCQEKIKRIIREFVDNLLTHGVSGLRWSLDNEPNLVAKYLVDCLYFIAGIDKVSWCGKEIHTDKKIIGKSLIKLLEQCENLSNYRQQLQDLIDQGCQLVCPKTHIKEWAENLRKILHNIKDSVGGKEKGVQEH